MSQLVPRSQVATEETWDMTLLYPSDEAFRDTLKQFQQDVTAFKEHFEGQLADAEQLKRAVAQYEALLKTFGHLEHYAFLPMSVDRFNETVIANNTLFEQVAQHWATHTSFLKNELTDLPYSALDAFVADSRPDLAYWVERIKKQKAHILGKEAELVLSAFDSLPSYSHLYEVTKFEDMQFDPFEVNGKTYENSYVLYENLYEMDEDPAVRRAAAESFYKTLRAYRHTTANEYLAHIKKEKLLANLRGYDSVIDYLLDRNDGDRELYDRQIEVLQRDLAPHIQRYVRLLAREHQIDDMQFADVKINLDPDFEVDMTIAESRDYLKKALGVLGDDYVRMIDESYEKRWTDFPQNIGKSTGGFCATVQNVAAFILLSWTGKMNEVFVLAHELGHAYHFMHTGKHQSPLNFDCPLYFVEAPSTCNEVLVSNYLLQTSKDSRLKRWVISNMISRTYFHNMVTHYLEAVFQDKVYKKLDNNEPLTADILSNLKREVMQNFFGDSLTINEGAELTWMRQPHYYFGLYPYTYSAGLTIGTAVANKIAQQPEQVSIWLDTLSKGSSLSDRELSQHAGCDVSTEQPLQDAIAYVGHLVDELYRLTDELKQQPSQP